MSIVNDVITIIRNNPGITAAEIKECAGITDATTKAILWRLSESNRITRQKTASGKKKGPRAVFAYQLKELDHGIQEKAREEINAEQITSASQTDSSSSPRSEIRQEGGYPPIYR